MVSKQLQKSTNYPTEVLSDMDFKYLDTLDELHFRLFIATRADSLGKHGVSLVSNAIHVDRKTVYRGLHDLKCCNIPEDGRVRKVGGGPKRVLNEHPEYLDIFDELVESHTAGLPQDDTVRWLDLNVSQIQDKFKDRSISVSEYFGIWKHLSLKSLFSAQIRGETRGKVQETDINLHSIAIKLAL